MIAWDADTIRWFSAASAYTGYHEALADLLLRRLGGFASAYDLGAGSGELTLALARRGVQVAAVEMQETAVLGLRERVRAAGLADRITVVQGDWTTLDAEALEVGILSYCDGVVHHWDALRRLCRRALAALKGNAAQAAPLCALAGDKCRRKQKHETAADIRAALSARGARFAGEPHSGEFGQILQDAADLAVFLDRYYGPRMAARLQEAEALCQHLPDGRLYLPRRRDSMLFLIQMDPMENSHVEL